MRGQKKYLAAIFDLDGVIVDTAKYHYLAWKELANDLGFDFTEKDNELLKGVSRMASLDILLGIGKKTFSDEEKIRLADQKNKRYVEYLQTLEESELLPGARNCLETLRKKGIKTALGSASKNAPLILEKLGIEDCFDAIVDGNMVSKAKPDPEVFQVAAKLLGQAPENCIVFEDAQAGIEAAKAIDCLAIAIGNEENLKGADLYIASLAEFPIADYF